MKKEAYSTEAFATVLRGLIALAGAADTPPVVIYAAMRSWIVAYEILWQEYGVPPEQIAKVQVDTYAMAREIANELRKNPPIRGHFPDEILEGPAEGSR